MMFRSKKSEFSGSCRTMPSRAYIAIIKDTSVQVSFFVYLLNLLNPVLNLIGAAKRGADDFIFCRCPG